MGACMTKKPAEYKDVSYPTVEETAAVELWLTNEVKLPEYIKTFIDNGFDDMEVITKTLTENILEEIGIKKLGHRKKIMLFANKLSNKLSHVTSDHSSDEYSIDSNCEDVQKCAHAKRLLQIINEYNQQNQCEHTQQIDILQIMNDFLHLIENHNIDTEFEFIAEQLDTCDISQCTIFRKLYHMDNQMNNRDIDNKTNAQINILSRIHCYFQHSHDIGNRLSSKDKMSIGNCVDEDGKNYDSDDEFTRMNYKKIRELTSNKKQNYQQDRINSRYYVQHLFGKNEEKHEYIKYVSNDEVMFCFGYKFKYGYDDEVLCGSQCIDVSAKESSLKIELTQNAILSLSISQFDVELEKAEILYNSDYCRRSFEKDVFTLEHLLSLMVYCNFDNLQREFTKTYREGFYDQHSNFYLLHNNFYHLGKNLKICVHQFGNAALYAVYHGIGQRLSFPDYINQCKHRIVIQSPLSTSSAFAVATNFTNNNNGLIIEFGENSWASNSARCFSMQWLSDFANEQEYLFIQNKYALCIVNIYDPSEGVEYGMILSALNKIEKIMSTNYFLRYHQTKDVMVKILSHQLSKKNSSYSQFTSLNEYGTTLIDTYFNNKIDATLDYLHVSKYTEISNIILGDKEQNCYIGLAVIIMLFPNIEHITVQNIPEFNKSVLDDLVSYLNTQTDSKLQTVTMELLNCTSKYQEVVSDYRQRIPTVTLNVRSTMQLPEVGLGRSVMAESTQYDGLMMI